MIFKEVPGFLSRFHQLLLKIPGAGWFARFEILFALFRKTYLDAPGFLSRFHQWLLKIPGAGWFARFDVHIVCTIWFFYAEKTY